MPLEVIADTRWLERRLATAPPGTGECQLLAEAEGLLHRDAKGEAFGRSWLFHVGNVVVNVALGLVIAAGFHHWLSGGISSAVGIAVGEAQILTQPTGAVTALARYRRGDLGPAPASAPAAPVISLAPLAAPRAAGIALAIGF
jgi:hypothetical protein